MSQDTLNKTLWVILNYIGPAAFAGIMGYLTVQTTLTELKTKQLYQVENNLLHARQIDNSRMNIESLKLKVWSNTQQLNTNDLNMQRQVNKIESYLEKYPPHLCPARFITIESTLESMEDRSHAH